MFRGKRKFIVMAATGTAAIVAAGTAYALWTANGSGSAGSKALNATTITVTAGTGAADLYPGFNGGDLFFTMTNTNPYPVTFTTMTPGTVASSDPTNCPASNVTVTGASGLSLAVGGNASAPGTIANVATMVTSAPDGCQGVTFTIPVTLTGSQS